MAKLHKWLKVPLYSANLCLIATADHAHERFGLPVEDSWGGCAGFGTNGYSDSDHFLVISAKKHYTMDVLAHEATHVSWHILDQMGVKLSADNHEAQTYLISWIMRESIKFFDKAFQDAEADTGKN